MKPWIAIALFVTVTGVADAQRGFRGPINPSTMSPVHPIPAPVNATRFGNILFPGGTPTTHVTNLGRTIAGVPYTGVGPGFPGHGGRRNRTIVVPYAVPVYYGGFGYGYGYGNAMYAQQEPNVTVVVPQQPAPTVIINNHYGNGQAPESTTITTGETAPEQHGGLRVYEPSRRAAATPAPSPQPEEQKTTTRTYVRDDKPNIYAIALRDGTTRDAIGYWLKGDSLQFVTPQATIGTVDLAQVDIAETRRRNNERKLEFELVIP